MPKKLSFHFGVCQRLSFRNSCLDILPQKLSGRFACAMHLASLSQKDTKSVHVLNLTKHLVAWLVKFDLGFFMFSCFCFSETFFFWVSELIKNFIFVADAMCKQWLADVERATQSLPYRCLRKRMEGIPAPNGSMVQTCANHISQSKLL